MPQINVHLLPSLVPAEDLADRTVVLIDVLRATTTIIHALASGAVSILPCGEPDEARQLAGSLSGPVVLGGERGGLPIEGFDLGNSPDEYTPEMVSGKTVVFTTTNGTRAMLHCRSARRVLIGAFVNFSALCHKLATQPAADLVCAGTENQVTREDVLLAGAVVDDVQRRNQDHVALNDQAHLAADAWREAVRRLSGSLTLAETLRTSRGGRNMIRLGQQRDIEIAAHIDKFDIVPELETARWQIHLT